MPSTDQYTGRDLEAMAFAGNYSNWIIQRCRPYLGERTAEVGAGCGNLSQLLLSETSISELSLYEPAGNLYSQLVNQFSGDPVCQLSNQRLIDAVQVRQQYYDTILYINVLEHIKGFDMVIVSRYLGDAASEDDDIITRFGNWLFTRTVNLLFNARYTDVMVMYRAYKKQVIYDLELDKDAAYITPETLFRTRVSWEPLLSVRAAKRNLKIGEIPGDEPPRIGDYLHAPGRYFASTSVPTLAAPIRPQSQVRPPSVEAMA